MADTPAAAPATNAAAKPAPAARPTDATFDARVAAAKTAARSGVAAALPAEPKGGKAAPKAPPKPAPKATAAEFEDLEGEGEENSETEETTDTDEAETDESEETEAEDTSDDDGAELGTAEERLAAATSALEKGDVEAFVKALGDAGKKIPAPTLKAFRSIARREKRQADREKKHGEQVAAFEAEVGRARHELTTESGRIVALQRQAANEYGFAKRGRDAWKAEEYADVGKALEAWLETDLATITQKLASGKAGKTPTEKAVDQRLAALEKREKELEAKQKAAGEQQSTAQQRAEAMVKVGKHLESHPYLVTVGEDGKPAQDKEALEEVFAAYDASWDGKRFTKTPKQIADELQAKLEKRAQSRGLVKAPAAAPAGKTAAASSGKTEAATPPKRPAKTTPHRQPEPPRSGATAAPLDLDATRALRVANAKRMSEQQRRGLRP